MEGQIKVDFAKRLEKAVLNTYFKKREEHGLMHESTHGWTISYAEVAI